MSDSRGDFVRSAPQLPASENSNVDRSWLSSGFGPEALACARALAGTPATAARVAIQSETCMNAWLSLP